MLLQTAWLCGWTTLVIFNIVAVWDISLETCQCRYPILLSRALTTDPYRGITLGYCLLSIAATLQLNSSVLSAAFFGFFSAFLVSMFETSAHNALIFVSAALVMWECRPQHFLWTIHWWVTVVGALICVTWLGYSHFELTGQDSRCSWWYLSEYLLFWSMYLLVYWKIPPEAELQDKVVSDREKAIREKAIIF